MALRRGAAFRSAAAIGDVAGDLRGADDAPVVVAIGETVSEMASSAAVLALPDGLEWSTVSPRRILRQDFVFLALPIRWNQHADRAADASSAV